VGDCPTNEDPEYDISACSDYVCKFCKERGTHYFMFCPRNPDPNSIYRRRQERALQNIQSSPSHGDLGLKRTFVSPPRFPEAPGPATPPRSKIVLPKFSSPTADFEFFTKDKRINSRELITGSLKDDNIYDIEVGMSGVAMRRAQARTAEDDYLNKGRPETLGSSDGDMVWERLKNDIQREQLRGPPQQLNTFTKQNVIERTITETNAPAMANQSPHANFLSKLFEKHPSQPNPRWRPRMTALNMWDISDEKKRQEENEEMARLNERELSTDPKTPDYNRKKNRTHHSNCDREDLMDIGDDDYSTTLKQDKEQVNFLVDTNGFQEREKHQAGQEDSPTQEVRVRAIQERMNSIESLRTKLASGEDMKSPEMEQIISGGLSQEELDEIFRRVRSPEPPSPPGLTSSSSELSSPPRLSSSGSRRAGGPRRIS
jgi:hypothetical protein